MTREVLVTKPGGPEVLKLQERALPEPSAGEILIGQAAIGVNFIDIYQRTGVYPLPALPAVIGVEGVGRILALGPGVSGLQVGDRIAYAGPPVGAYASERLLPAARAIAVPDDISDELAVTAMIKGLTAHMLLTRTHAVGRDTTLLVHAAAGGLGSLLVKWAKRLGARVIGTVGSEEKAALARQSGADHVIVGRDADFVNAVLDWTSGRGVDVAYDGIGSTTLTKTFGCVRRFGTVASIGQAAGPIPKLSVEEIGPARSLVFARPSIMAYVSEPDTYRQSAAALFEALQDGLDPSIGRGYPLAEAAQAHRDLEGGRTTGSTFLIP